jgi:hypothetical protein
MSVQALSCAMAIRGVSASEKLLLLVLANFADEGMACWPSHKRLADDTGLSQRSVLSLLKALEEKRFITRAERKRPDGSRTSDKITLHFSGEVISPRGETAAGGGEISDTGVGKPTAGGGEIISPLTTFEPTTEPKDEPRRADPRDLAKTIWELQPKLNGKRRSTQPDVHRALTAALKRGADGDEIVNACRGYYALPASRKQGGEFAMGAERLLQADRWREFEPAAPVVLAPAQLFPDAEIRAAVIGIKGEAWAASWLDPCSWEPERRVIVPRNGLAAQRLRSEVMRVLQARHATIQELAA